jgi:PAS domain S-box-containing protein
MKLRPTLKTKFVSILIFILALQLLLLGSLNLCRLEYQNEIQQLFKAKRVNDAVNVIQSELSELDAIMTMRTFTPRFINSLNLAAVERWRRYYDTLSEAVRGNAKDETTVESSHKATKQAFAELTSLQSHSSILENETNRQYWLARLGSMAEQIRSPDLLDINERAKEIVDQSPARQESIQKKEKMVLLVGVLLNVFVSLSVGILFIREISSRLNVIAENSHRLAAGKQLKDRLKGEDEICALDTVFRQMASSLKESERKERAIVENARDMICSIDDDGKFVACNSASLRVLGIKSEDILGMRYISLIEKDDIHRMCATIEGVTNEKEVQPFEVRMRRATGEIVDTLWTAYWSRLDKTLFCVIHDDSERKQAERMKQEVVAMITHDLRTPVATLRNVLEMLSADMFGKLDERGKGMLKVADTSTAQMLSLINDLLDIEKIKAGMLELNLADVDLDAVLDSTCNALSPAALERQITVEVRRASVQVIADEERLARVITNLVANALKFSPPKTTISVFADKQDGFAKISVQDEGRGIPEQLLPSIFDRFTQVKSSDARLKGGSGLGLSICKALVELHGGTISATSIKNQGSTFSFTVPLVKTNF